MPRAPRACSVALMDRRPSGTADASMISTPAPSSARRRAGSAAAAVMTQVGTSCAVANSLAPGGRRNCRSSTTRTGERSFSPGSRQVSSGSSASAVPVPTRIASWVARRPCARRRAGSPVIQRLSPLVAMRPSSEVASFRLPSGRPRLMRRKKPALSSAASSAHGPRSTRMPAAAQHGDPAPGHARVRILDRGDDAADAGGDQGVGAGRRLAGVGAGLERDVRRGPARGVAGAPEGLGLGMRAPARLGPAAPDHLPSRTSTQPTAGLGQVRPRPRAADG